MHNVAFMFIFNSTMVEYIAHHNRSCTVTQKNNHFRTHFSLFKILGGHLRAFLKHYMQHNTSLRGGINRR